MKTEETQRTLSDIGITHPEQWNLVLKLTDSRVDYALQSNAADGAFTVGSLTLDPAAGDRLKQIEDALYSTPLPGNDFRTVSVVADTTCFMFVPHDLLYAHGEADADEMRDKLLNAAFAECSGDTTVSDSCCTFSAALHGTEATLLWGLDSRVVNFFQRTFYNVTFSHPMHTVAQHALRRGRMANTPRMCLVADENCWYAVVCSGTRLLYANRFTATNVPDATFFILTAWKEMQLSQHDAEMLVAGNSRLRPELEESLRQYIKLVLPDIYPPRLFKLSRETALYPFDMMLKLISVCE